jgi:hypothetical protein
MRVLLVVVAKGGENATNVLRVFSDVNKGMDEVFSRFGRWCVIDYECRAASARALSMEGADR